MSTASGGEQEGGQCPFGGPHTGMTISSTDPFSGETITMRVCSRCGTPLS
jgi:hypothetical protein